MHTVGNVNMQGNYLEFALGIYYVQGIGHSEEPTFIIVLKAERQKGNEYILWPSQL